MCNSSLRKASFSKADNITWCREWDVEENNNEIGWHIRELNFMVGNTAQNWKLWRQTMHLTFQVALAMKGFETTIFCSTSVNKAEILTAFECV